jgi:hypothetical protein
MENVLNHRGVHLKIGDKIQIISEKIGNKLLANVDFGEIVEITGFSDDGKIIYHHNSLALPTNSDIYKKITHEY